MKLFALLAILFGLIAIPTGIQGALAWRHVSVLENNGTRVAAGQVSCRNKNSFSGAKPVAYLTIPSGLSEYDFIGEVQHVTDFEACLEVFQWFQAETPEIVYMPDDPDDGLAVIDIEPRKNKMRLRALLGLALGIPALVFGFKGLFAQRQRF